LKLEPKLGSKTRSSSKTRTEPRPESGTGTEIFEKQLFLRGQKKFGTRVNWQLTCFLIFIMVEQLVSEQDPRGGLSCFWCPNKT
jgi:hypothetical protein